MRIRITFSKQGALRYTGNLDLHKIWERTARRADLALAYSQGFHPQPKMQLAAALPEFFIRLLTEEDDLVLDPFAGSNTTGAVAEQLNRRWIAVEKDELYLRASKFRFG